jgi:hypothetical protein
MNAAAAKKASKKPAAKPAAKKQPAPKPNEKFSDQPGDFRITKPPKQDNAPTHSPQVEKFLALLREGKKAYGTAKKDAPPFWIAVAVTGDKVLRVAFSKVQALIRETKRKDNEVEYELVKA